MSDSQYARKQCKTIVECFDTKDVETLEKMFSSSTREKCNLEKEIQEGFELFEGESKHWNFIYGGTDGGMDNGKWIDKHIMPSIKIETNTGKKYEIEFYEFLVYKKDKAVIGIKKIFLYDSNGDRIAVIGDNGGL